MASLIEHSEIVKQAIALGAIQVPEELEQIISLVAGMAPANIMEIGAEAGGTFYVWCQLATGLKISVDLPTGKSGSWNYAEKDALDARTERMLSWGEGVCVITGDSHSAEVRNRVGSILKGRDLDFLFIDGDHTYDGVKRDFNTYREYVRPGGLIAFHDIKDTPYHQRLGCHVADFWKELTGEKKEFCSDADWGGIGVIRN